MTTNSSIPAAAFIFFIAIKWFLFTYSQT